MFGSLGDPEPEPSLDGTFTRTLNAFCFGHLESSIQEINTHQSTSARLQVSEMVAFGDLHEGPGTVLVPTAQHVKPTVKPLKRPLHITPPFLWQNRPPPHLRSPQDRWGSGAPGRMLFARHKPLNLRNGVRFGFRTPCRRLAGRGLPPPGRHAARPATLGAKRTADAAPERRPVERRRGRRRWRPVGAQRRPRLDRGEARRGGPVDQTRLGDRGCS